MELWNRISGSAQAELTAAEPMALLGRLAQAGVILWDIVPKSELTLLFRVRRQDLPKVSTMAERGGGKLRLLGLSGLWYRAASLLKRPVVVLTLGLLTGLSVWLPGRILFIDVQGCEAVPPRLILETAEQFGLEFGASRRDVRSERIKNELLGAIPELEWVGVNTCGSTAAITVREREPSGEEESLPPGNVVAVCDAIVEDITLIRGTNLCAPGDAVRQGQVLVSGFQELGIVTRAVSAEAEIYGRTACTLTARQPEETVRRGQISGNWTKYSLLVGKKRINLYSDSGILPPTCGKMTQVIPLRLPAGRTLPVALVVERYTAYETEAVSRQEDTAREEIRRFARQYLRSTMVAGSILTERWQEEGVCVMTGRFECRQMIAARQETVRLEGDTEDDPENSERGAG